jgi:hypothetical protein
MLLVRPTSGLSASEAPAESLRPSTSWRTSPFLPRVIISGNGPRLHSTFLSSTKDNREPARTQVRVPPARPAARTQDSPSCAPPGPRLLTRQQAAD